MNLRRILSGLAALGIAAASLSVAAGAVEPSYKVSEDYQDSLYYENLQAVELTGDGVTDVIAVALSQLGYHEGNGNADLDGRNNGGSKNFTEYNVLFGKLDNGEGNGTSYGYAWCAAFVNWCLRQARVDKELTGGMYVSCASWRNWFINEGAKYGASYHARTDDYIPQRGDLIFYKSLSATHNRATDHIGIVLKCEDGKVYAIEGNADNKVGLHEYELTNRYIVGYGSIAYKTADVPETEYYDVEKFLPGQYISSKGNVSVYAGPGSSFTKVASLDANEVYRITAVQDKYGYLTLEDGTSGWVSLKRLIPMNASAFFTVELEAGEQSVKAIVAQGASWQIPELTLDGDMLGWSAGEGSELFAPGQVITPESDLVLKAAYPAESETQPESETEAATAPESSEDEQTTAEEQSTASEPQTGCNGTVGAAAVGIVLAACAAFACKKKKA